MDKYGARTDPSDERADVAEVIDVVRNAVTAENGWKRILQRCAPPRRGSRIRLGD